MTLPIHIYTGVQLTVSKVTLPDVRYRPAIPEGIHFVFDYSADYLEKLVALEKEFNRKTSVSGKRPLTTAEFRLLATRYENPYSWTRTVVENNIRNLLAVKFKLDSFQLDSHLGHFPKCNNLEDAFSPVLPDVRHYLTGFGINTINGIVGNGQKNTRLLIDGNVWVDAKGDLRQCWIGDTREPTPEFKRWVLSHEKPNFWQRFKKHLVRV